MSRFASRWILGAGLLVTVIGAIHSAFAPSVYRSLLTGSMEEQAAGFVYFFALGGAAFMYAGLSMTYASRGLRRSEGWARVIALGAGAFTLLGSLSAIVLGGYPNPLLYVTALCAASSIVVLLIQRGATPLPPPRHGRFFSGLVD